MAKFCGKCGSPLNETNGLCSVCDLQDKKVAVDFSGNISVPVMEDVEKTVAVEFTENQMNVESAPSFVPETTTNVSDVTYVAPVNENVGLNKQKPKKEKKVKKATPLSTFICIILSFCLFLTSLSALIIFDVRNTLKEENSGKLLNNLSVTSALEEFNVDCFDYLEDFYDFLYKDMDKFDVGNEDLDNLIVNSPVKDTIAKKISKFSEDFFDDGSAKFKIKKNDIVDALEDCDDYFEDEYDVYPKQQHYKKVADWILIDGDIDVVDTDDFGALSTVNRLGLSYASIIILVLLVGLIIFAMCKNNFRQALVGAGIVFIIIGAIFSIAAMVPLFTQLYTSSVVVLVIANFFAANWLSSVIILALGIIMLVAKKVIKVFDSKKTA